ncbi:hypothetical protein FM119_12710 [Mycetocola reblochoni REB411]|uniref:Uncharacterized protein n=1 Tax=Mycetocola reblochoni REB411 TaxID=1255698 RepID=A0A1R4KB66_9MICO|nr:hypothetical protein FM119_12710 [Mycetocola reblochoni REB411]
MSVPSGTTTDEEVDMPNTTAFGPGIATVLLGARRPHVSH